MESLEYKLVLRSFHFGTMCFSLSIRVRSRLEAKVSQVYELFLLQGLLGCKEPAVQSLLCETVSGLHQSSDLAGSGCLALLKAAETFFGRRRIDQGGRPMLSEELRYDCLH